MVLVTRMTKQEVIYVTMGIQMVVMLATLMIKMEVII